MSTATLTGARAAARAAQSGGLRHVHLSLRYDADLEAQAAYVAREAKGHNLLTTTEVYDPELARLIRGKLGAAWTVRRAGEYLVAVLHAEVVFDSELTVRRITRMWDGNDAWRDAYLASVRVRERASGRKHRVRVCHNASGVEAGGVYRRAGKGSDDWRKVEVNRRAGRAIGARVRADRLRTPRVNQVVCGDFNTNQRNAEWRKRTRRQLGLPTIWDPKHGVDGGTHRGPDGRWVRGIDVIASRGIRSAGRCSAPPAGMDHRGVWAVY